jgi:enterochelin esterase-like enzyme
MLKVQRQRQQQGTSDVRGAQRQASPFPWMVESLVLGFASSQIMLLGFLASIWPINSSSSCSSSSSSSNSRGSIWSSDELGSAVLPVVNLALLLLDASAGRVGYVLGVMGFVTLLCDKLLADLRHTSASAAADWEAVDSSNNNSNNRSSSTSTSGSSSGAVPISPGAQQLLQSEQLPKLLAATQALCVLRLRAKTRSQAGGSSLTGRSSSGSGIVPSSGGVQQAAEQILVTNIVSWDGPAIARINQDWQWAGLEGATAAALLNITAVLQHMLPCWAASRTNTDSSSSSSSRDSSVAGPAAQPAQQRHQQYLPLLVLVAQLRHWALLQVQLVQLVDSVGCKVECMKTLLAMLDAADAVGARLSTAVKKALLQPVLQQLLPHLQGVLATQEAAVSSSSSSSSSSCGGGSCGGDTAGVSGNAGPSSSSSGSSSSRTAGVAGVAAPSSNSSSSSRSAAGCDAGTNTAAGSSSSMRVALELGLSMLLLKLAQGGEDRPDTETSVS